MSILPESIRPERDVSVQPQSVDVDEIIPRLSNIGLGPDAIAMVLGLPKGKITGTLKRTRIVRSPEEEKLAESARRLADAAITQAFRILQFGPTLQRIVVIRAAIQGVGRLIAQDSGGGTEEAMVAFEDLRKEMTAVQPAEQIVTDHGYDPDASTEIIDASSTETVAETTYDQA